METYFVFWRTLTSSATNPEEKCGRPPPPWNGRYWDGYLDIEDLEHYNCQIKVYSPMSTEEPHQDKDMNWKLH